MRNDYVSRRAALAAVVASGLMVACTVAGARKEAAPEPGISPVPLSAIAVSQCGGAIALFVQLDATHLFRADPRQSDMFVAENGRMQHHLAGPLPWKEAIALAERAVLTSHVTLPCTEAPTT